MVFTIYSAAFLEYHSTWLFHRNQRTETAYSLRVPESRIPTYSVGAAPKWMNRTWLIKNYGDITINMGCSGAYGEHYYDCYETQEPVPETFSKIFKLKNEIHASTCLNNCF